MDNLTTTPFYKNLVRDLDIADLTSEMQLDILVSINQILIQNLLTNAILTLEGKPLEDLELLVEKLNENIDDKTDEEKVDGFVKVMNFLQENLPDFDRLLAEQVAEIKDSFTKE